MRILYLYSELMGYQIPILREYVEKYNAQVHVVHWDQMKLTPYIPPDIINVTYYKRSEYSKKQLIILANKIDPNIVYISGWQDRSYLSVVKLLRRKGVPIVTGFDDQWKGNVKQYIASLIFPLLLKRYFSHAWVAGPYQYEYARKLGFKKNNIVFNLLSGDTILFQKGIEFINEKAKCFPKRFLYVGNFRYIKGIDILINAFNIYRNIYKGSWDLICIGNGELKYLSENVPGIENKGFSDQDKLVEITKKAGVFILPSRFDQWGVVVHEFASAGMPLILSENVGARSTFIIDNYNGLTFKNNSPDNLAKAMHCFSNKSDSELIQMSKNSYHLSHKINPEIVAASFISIINK